MRKIIWKNRTETEGYFMQKEEETSFCKCKRLPGDIIPVDNIERPICPTCKLPLEIVFKEDKNIPSVMPMSLVPEKVKMTLSDFELYYEQLVDLERKLLRSKGIEYSGKEDRFNNFNKLGKELQLRPEKILWIYLKKHLDGILSYINGEYAGGEPIIGRINDARNYLALLAGMITAKGGGK